jgi:hypothetical protein
MSGIAVFVGKFLLGQVMSYGTKRVTANLLGDIDVRAVTALCHDILGAALAEELRPYEPVADEDRVHLLDVLELALGIMADPLESTGNTGDAGLRDALVRVRSSEVVDWATFQILHEGEFVRLDEAEILRRFLTALPIRLREAAGRADSPVHNLVARLDSAELQRTLAGLADDLGALRAAGTTATWRDAHDRAIARQRAMVGWRLSSDFGRSAYVPARAVAAWIPWEAGED